MSDHFSEFQKDQCRVRVVLPFALDQLLSNLATLRKTMCRSHLEVFTRNEWAYLIHFLDENNLLGIYGRSFGRPALANGSGKMSCYRPKSQLAVWLPSNVSLLGPLTLIVCILSGVKNIRLKTSSRAEDLTSHFVDYIKKMMGDSVLAKFVASSVSVVNKGQDHPAVKQMAKEADVRIVFGSDATALDIQQTSLNPTSQNVAFIDKTSEAWIDKESSNLEDVLADLVKVFHEYGKVGCTSPQRLILIDHSKEEALRIRTSLLEIYHQIFPDKPEMHIASNTTLANQILTLEGWNCLEVKNKSALFAVGSYALETYDGMMSLPIIPSDILGAIQNLPQNIQTIGCQLSKSNQQALLNHVGKTQVKRIVPLQEMHNFGSLWDGLNFFDALFEQVEVSFM